VGSPNQLYIGDSPHFIVADFSSFERPSMCIELMPATDPHLI
jgi:hypothetical protein